MVKDGTALTARPHQLKLGLGYLTFTVDSPNTRTFEGSLLLTARIEFRVVKK